MHKLIASLLLALAAAALLSASQAASPRTTRETALLTAKVLYAAGLVDQRQFTAKAGDYFDMQLEGDLLLSLRLTALDAGTAQIDAVVARSGRTLSEPSLRIARRAPASLELTEPPLTLQFEVR